MTKEILELSAVPCDEDCEQLGPNYDPIRARAECRIFKEQLEAQSPPPEGAYLKITSNPHDFGNYHEVAAVFDYDKPKEREWAFRLENNLPAKWTEESLVKLSELS